MVRRAEGGLGDPCAPVPSPALPGHRPASQGGRPVFAAPVTDWAELKTYLLKEATPQAWYGAGKSFRRRLMARVALSIYSSALDAATCSQAVRLIP